MMKAKFLIGLAALSLFAVSCDKEVGNSEIVENQSRTYTVVMEQPGDATRSTVTLGGEFSWENGDPIAVVGQSGAETVSLTVDDQTGVGTFSTSVGSPVYATYPAVAKTYANETLTVELPSTYGSTAEPYEVSTNAAMLAKFAADTESGTQSTETVEFKHLGSLLVIRLKDVPATVNKLVLTTNNQISGEFTVDGLDGDDMPAISTNVSESNNTVTFIFNAGKDVAAADDDSKVMNFYVPLPTGTYTQFDIELFSGSESHFKQTTKAGFSQDIVRRQLLILPELTVPEHAFVDLGLPSGTLWAKTNIGAATETEYGSYFAWGETEAKTSGFDWAGYELCNGSDKTLTKYSSADKKTVLDAEDDAATANWGSAWRMPTRAEFEELLTVGYVFVSNYKESGVYGCLFTATNGNTLFLPAAGHYESSGVNYFGENSFYWSSTLNSPADDYYSGPSYANYLYCDKIGSKLVYHNSRCYGLPVRPVYNPNASE